MNLRKDSSRSLAFGAAQPSRFVSGALKPFEGIRRSFYLRGKSCMNPSYQHPPWITGLLPGKATEAPGYIRTDLKWT